MHPADTMNLLDANAGFRQGALRAVLVSFSVPGYYSIPVRQLALLAARDPQTAERWDVKYAEWDNRIDPETDLAPLLDAGADLIGFSVNIWNLQLVQTVCARLKKEQPSLRILCGGQEVTRSVRDDLRQNPAWDYIIDGEGEAAFLQFLNAWDEDRGDLADPAVVSGLLYRDAAGGETRRAGGSPPETGLEELPSVILADMVPARQRNRLGAMIEGARGCPCKCTFCFEGDCNRRVRYAAVSTIEEEARFMLQKGSRMIHLLDPIVAGHDLERTRAVMDVFDRLYAEFRDMRVSVEAYAERLSPESIALLGKPCMTLDIGLQSLNPDTLKAIRRPFVRDRFIDGITALNRTPACINIYLICGLPFETPQSYLQGIRETAALNPGQLFLNELVLLNGTELRRQADSGDWGYVYKRKPPYNVCQNRWIPARAMCALNAFSRAFYNWYNSRRNASAVARTNRAPEPAGHRRRACRLMLREGHLQSDDGTAPTNEKSDRVEGARICLRVQQSSAADAAAALLRLYLWGASRVTALLVQSELPHAEACAPFRLLSVRVQSPATLLRDLDSFCRDVLRDRDAYGCCLELDWPNEPLPADPDFYRRLARLPVFILIRVAQIADDDSERLRTVLEAAHAARIWVRLPGDASAAEAAMKTIWGAASAEILEELRRLDDLFESGESVLAANTQKVLS